METFNKIIRTVLAVNLIVFSIGVILWVLWAIGWIIMYVFPVSAAMALSTLAVICFYAWRAS